MVGPYQIKSNQTFWDVLLPHKHSQMTLLSLKSNVDLRFAKIFSNYNRRTDKGHLERIIVILELKNQCRQM